MVLCCNFSHTKAILRKQLLSPGPSHAPAIMQWEDLMVWVVCCCCSNPIALEHDSTEDRSSTIKGLSNWGRQEGVWMGTPLPLEKPDMGCALCQRETVLQGFVDYSVLGEHTNSQWHFHRRLAVPERGYKGNTLSYFGNPGTSEKYLPYAHAGNLRLHLSHPLGKVWKKEKGTVKSAEREQGNIQDWESPSQLQAEGSWEGNRTVLSQSYWSSYCQWRGGRRKDRL